MVFGFVVVLGELDLSPGFVFHTISDTKPLNRTGEDKELPSFLEQ